MHDGLPFAIIIFGILFVLFAACVKLMQLLDPDRKAKAEAEKLAPRRRRHH